MYRKTRAGGTQKDYRRLYDRLVESLRPLQHRWESADGVVALTFDDGPSKWTIPILELLARHDSEGTFFVVGRHITEEHEGTLRRIVAAGSELGNHTFTHPANIGELPLAELRNELHATSERIEAVIEARPRFWRAPHFHSNLKARTVAAGLGLREAGASVIPADYQWPAEQTAAFVLDALRPGDVVDLHDGRPVDEPAEASAAHREETVQAVSIILGEMEARGLRSVALSELADAPTQPDATP
jgi:peptidoglycan/xylan/chitin deacetylase (PgdA/CDA1 family)